MSNDPPLRILLADDEPRILEEYEQILRGADFDNVDRQTLKELETDLFGDEGSGVYGKRFDLCMCRQSHEAVAAVEESMRDDRPFAVAFIDFRMPPGANGAVAAERIRKLDPDINIVFITAYSDIGLSDIVARIPPPDKILYCRKPLHASELRHFAHALSAKWTTERHLKATQAHLEQIINSTPVIVYCREAVPTYRATFVSSNIRQEFGYDEASFLNEEQPWLERVHPEDLGALREALERLHAHGEIAAEYRFRLPDGSFRWVSDQAKLLRDAFEQPSQLVGCLTDITERRRAEERIRHLAYFDGLTGLPNRFLMRELLDQALSRARRHHGRLAVLFIDLDQFKRVNDTLGHAVGDQLLRTVSERLLTCIRHGDTLFHDGRNDSGATALSRLETISRHGGDEFVIILPEIRSAEDPAHVAERIAAILSDPIELQDREITVSASIGISVYPHDGEDGETLLKNADTAMYHAKDQGRNCCAFFNGAISQRATRRFTLESGLRRAVEQGELSLVYQPRIDLRARKAIGMEALVRWPLPDGSCVMPAEFVPIAEETGLIQPLGEWVFYEACRQNVAWLRDSMPSLVVSVNVSTMQFKKKDFVRLIRDVLLKTGLAATLLEIELTEGLLIDDTPITKNIMASLQELGVRVSIDDFGTGYSSLSYLKNFTFDALKLDQSLIRDVSRSSSGAAIVKATIGLAHDLGLRIVAEGVEEQVQLDFLTMHGCDEAQGYLFAPALEGGEFATWIRDNLDFLDNTKLAQDIFKIGKLKRLFFGSGCVRHGDAA